MLTFSLTQTETVGSFNRFIWKIFIHQTFLVNFYSPVLFYVTVSDNDFERRTSHSCNGPIALLADCITLAHVATKQYAKHVQPSTNTRSTVWTDLSLRYMLHISGVWSTYRQTSICYCYDWMRLSDPFSFLVLSCHLYSGDAARHWCRFYLIVQSKDWTKNFKNDIMHQGEKTGPLYLQSSLRIKILFEHTRRKNYKHRTCRLKRRRSRRGGLSLIL